MEKVSPFVLDHGYIFFFRCDLVDNLFAQISFLLIIKFLLSRRHNRGDKINNICILYTLTTRTNEAPFGN